MIQSPIPNMKQQKRASRSGFSLLEILLALAILGGSLAILSRIVDTGAGAAREARDLSVARHSLPDKTCRNPAQRNRRDIATERSIDTAGIL